jgi:hypothetical protein
MKKLLLSFLIAFIVTPAFATSLNQNSTLQPGAYQNQRQALQPQPIETDNSIKYYNKTTGYQDSYKNFNNNYSRNLNSGSYYDGYKRYESNYNKSRY